MVDYTRQIEETIQSNPNINNLQDDGGYLEFDPITRMLIPKEGFNNLIGVTNEINSSIISFKINGDLDGHKIADCDNHVIKWSNTASGEKGVDNLIGTIGNDIWTWVIPPEVMTKAGSLKIALSFYDIENDTITYLCNSLPYNALRIEQGMDEISIEPIPDDNIVYVDTYTRKITVPATLANPIAMVGEYGEYLLRIRCDRFYFNKDFYEEKYQINVLYNFPGIEGTSFTGSLSKKLIQGSYNGSDISKRGDLLEFTWEIDLDQIDQVGNIEFAIQISSVENGKPFTAWKSETNNSLFIGQTLVGNYDNGETEDVKTITVFGAAPEAGEGIEIDNGKISLADDLIFEAGGAPI